MQPTPLSDVADAMADVVASMREPTKVEETLELITRSAAETIPGILEASISITTRGGEIQTLAPTGPRVTRADHLQYELHEGPCLDAAIEESVVIVNDLASDPRWPDFGPKAAALGFGSQVAFQFRADPHVRGALNLYADGPYGLDQDSIHLGSMFAGQIAVAMGWAKQEQTLTEALATRNLIGQAVGIVMERYQLDSDRAFAFLVRLSQSANKKLRTVAATLVDTANEAAK
ncbi:MAG: hypothetical protein QOF10_5918, partial [Kribbellaceae bacterium]|nr:hypothetical protein [Kribbellaceae bacterium]